MNSISKNGLRSGDYDADKACTTGTTPTSQISAKARHHNERSDAILVSFDARWFESIRRRKIQKVLRKRVPKRDRPTWMYLYVNAPVSALVGRARVTKITESAQASAMRCLEELCLSRSEILSYFAGSRAVGMYWINSIELAEAPLSLNNLRENMVFHPPQSFLVMSVTGKAVIDKLCRFAHSTGARSSR